VWILGVEVDVQQLFQSVQVVRLGLAIVLGGENVGEEVQDVLEEPISKDGSDGVAQFDDLEESDNSDECSPKVDILTRSLKAMVIWAGAVNHSISTPIPAAVVSPFDTHVIEPAE